LESRDCLLLKSGKKKVLDQYQKGSRKRSKERKERQSRTASKVWKILGSTKSGSMKKRKPELNPQVPETWRLVGRRSPHERVYKRGKRQTLRARSQE